MTSFASSLRCVLATSLLALSAGLTPVPVHAQPTVSGTTLEAVRERGFLRCGVTELGAALTTLSADGKWIGFYPEFCRAVAAAVSGDANNVEFVMVSAGARFDALRDESFDLLSEASTWTMSRNLEGLDFPAVNFHDGQGVMVFVGEGAKTDLRSIDQLRGQTLCVPGMGTGPQNLRDYSNEHQLNLGIQTFATIEGAFHAFFDRQCAAISTDTLILASVRLSLAPNPVDYRILDTYISHEPISLVVRADDPQWSNLVRWTFFALLRAEELGIHKNNVQEMQRDGATEVLRLLGNESQLMAPLGLAPDWAAQVIAQVGNYGDIYDRWLGPKTAFNLERGRNALSRDGGLLWAPPIR